MESLQNMAKSFDRNFDKLSRENMKRKESNNEDNLKISSKKFQKSLSRRIKH